MGLARKESIPAARHSSRWLSIARGQGNDRDVCFACFQRTYAPGGLEPIHLRHLHVHHDQIEGRRLHCREGLIPVLGQRSGMPKAFEHALGDFLVHEVIIGDQNA
jgi:hypothetical protein